MRDEDIKALFDQQAAGYDERWAKTAPIRQAQHFLLDAVFTGLPEDARVLCVGAGTGEEIEYLAARHPHWTFTAVEPSGAMLEICRGKAERGGYAARCRFHEGYLDSLPVQAPFHAATCLLVSQFILDRTARSAFFAGIAARLRAGGLLVSADLSSPASPAEYDALLETWMNTMAVAGIASAGLAQLRETYARDVAVLPAQDVASIIKAGGFEVPVKFYQAGLISAWYAARA